jgi:hypothetical protein
MLDERIAARTAWGAWPGTFASAFVTRVATSIEDESIYRLPVYQVAFLLELAHDLRGSTEIPELRPGVQWLFRTDPSYVTVKLPMYQEFSNSGSDSGKE